MAQKYVKIESEQMQGVKRFVKAMTKSMTFDENMEKADWPRQRRRNNFFYRLMPCQKNVSFKKVNMGNKGAMLTTYNETKDNAVDDSCVILYLHGGGFVTGSAYVCKSYCSMLAKYSKYRVYAAEYSLAPEKPFPHGFDDCCKVFEAVTKLHPDSKIALVGESAGGNYSLALGLKYKATGKIACVIVHSPTIDFSEALDHSINENKDFIVKKGANEPLMRIYVGKNDPKNMYISPYYGDYTDYPPTFISCDINETLYADSKALYEKCTEAGVDVQLVEFEGGYHACAVSGTNTPETTKVLEENIELIRKCCKR